MQDGCTSNEALYVPSARARVQVRALLGRCGPVEDEVVDAPNHAVNGDTLFPEGWDVHRPRGHMVAIDTRS